MMDSELERELAYVTSLPGYDRGSPQYFADPMVDRLVETIMMLAGEVWAIRDRQILSEHLMATEGKFTREALELVEPAESVLKQLKDERAAFVRRIFTRLYGPEIMETASGAPSTGDTMVSRGTAGSVQSV